MWSSRRFATVRLRTTAAKRFKKVENATALIWKMLRVAESTFRRSKGAELLPAVYAGVQYADGVPPSTRRQQRHCCPTVRAQPFSLPRSIQRSKEIPCPVLTVGAKTAQARSSVMSAPRHCRCSARPAELRIEPGQNSVMSARLLSSGRLHRPWRSDPKPISYTPLHLTERILAEQAAMEVRGATDGERKTITALFADLKGYAALIEGLGPEEARSIIDPALLLMMDEVHRYEGYVAQHLGRWHLCTVWRSNRL